MRLSEQVEKNPNDADAILTLANLNYDIRNWQRARELYERYLQAAAGRSRTCSPTSASRCAASEVPGGAWRRFEQAQQLQDGHWQSLYNEVVVLAFDLKDMPRAQQVLARLRQLQPDNPEVARLAEEVARRSGSA